AGPRRRNVSLHVVRRPLARLPADDRGLQIAVTELGAHHAGRLVSLDRGDVEEVPARGLARGRIVLDPWAVGVAPDLAARIAAARGRHVAGADLPALHLVGGEQLGSAPALEHRGELPRQVDRVAHAGIVAEAAGRNDEMAGVAG